MSSGYSEHSLTCVFTGIEGFSELSERYGAALDPVREAHFRLLREVAARWQGIEAGMVGDSLFLVFEQPSDAVQWAVDAQRTLRQYAWPSLAASAREPETVVEPGVRIGIHTGALFVGQRPGGAPIYFGRVVQGASRIAAAGHGRQILLSEATRALAAEALPANMTFQDLGQCRLAGAGEERLWQALHPDLPPLPHDSPPLRILHPGRHNLPLQPSPFIGRDTEIASWLEQLCRPAVRVLTLIGFGGIGKTRAALQLAELCVERFEDGAWFVALEEARTGEEMFQRIACQMHLSLAPAVPVQEQVQEYLHSRRILLVLDNTEQVEDATSVVRDLLIGAPHLKCLITSRHALELHAESVAEVCPLALSDAECLFADRARTCRADFAVTNENEADVAELCRRLEGVPLAIELAAARTVGMTPRQMLPRLSERFDLLPAGAAALPPGQRALRAVIDWSFVLLSKAERTLGAQLGGFAGGFAVEDAKAVCEGIGVLENVMALHRKALLRRETDVESGEARFMMPDGVREYALERLVETEDEEKGVRRRHAEHFLQFARRQVGRFRTEHEARALRQMEANGANINAAIQWAREEHEDLFFAEITLLAGMTLRRRGFLLEAAGPILAGLEAVRALPEPPDTLLGRFLLERAALHLDIAEAGPTPDSAEIEAARQKALEARALFVKAADAQGQGQAEHLLGQAAMLERAFTTARGHLRRALGHLERAGDAAGRAMVLNNLGQVERRDSSGNRTEASRHLQEALSLRRLQGDLRGIAETLNNLGVLAHIQSDRTAAWDYYAEALQNEQRLAHSFGAGKVLCNLGEVATQQGSQERACRLFAAAEYLLETMKSAHTAYAADLFAQASRKAGYSSDTIKALRGAARGRSLDDLAAWALNE